MLYYIAFWQQNQLCICVLTCYHLLQKIYPQVRKNDISSYLGIFMRYRAAVYIKDKYLGLISKSINDVRIFLENILKYLCTVGMRRYIRMVFFRQVVVLMPESIDVRMCLW